MLYFFGACPALAVMHASLCYAPCVDSCRCRTDSRTSCKRKCWPGCSPCQCPLQSLSTADPSPRPDGKKRMTRFCCILHHDIDARVLETLYYINLLDIPRQIRSEKYLLRAKRTGIFKNTMLATQFCTNIPGGSIPERSACCTWGSSRRWPVPPSGGAGGARAARRSSPGPQGRVRQRLPAGRCNCLGNEFYLISAQGEKHNHQSFL